MPIPSALVCVRCGARYPIDRFAEDCPACRPAGAPANLTVAYDSVPGTDRSRDDAPRPAGSMWRWEAFLPASAAEAVTLGEGNTPLLPAPSLGLGDVWIKDELRNPTWSFKDRLASSALTMAKQLRRQGHRLELLRQCRRGGGGLRRQGRPALRRLHLHRRRPGRWSRRCAPMAPWWSRSSDKADRWRLQSLGVREFGWYPTSPFFGPVVGSNPYGMEGYKTIAYEIAEAFDWQPPDWCVLPVCYGDALFGMWKGFEELKALGWIDRMPRFVAAEVSGSLAAAMASGEPCRPIGRATPPRSRRRSAPARAPCRRSKSCGAARAPRSRSRTTTIAPLGGDAGRQGRHLARAVVGRALCRHRAAARQRHDRARTSACVALLTASGLKDTAADRERAAASRRSCRAGCRK